MFVIIHRRVPPQRCCNVSTATPEQVYAYKTWISPRLHIYQSPGIRAYYYVNFSKVQQSIDAQDGREHLSNPRAIQRSSTVSQEVENRLHNMQAAPGQGMLILIRLISPTNTHMSSAMRGGRRVRAVVGTVSYVSIPPWPPAPSDARAAVRGHLRPTSLAQDRAHPKSSSLSLSRITKPTKAALRLSLEVLAPRLTPRSR